MGRPPIKTPGTIALPLSSGRWVVREQSTSAPWTAISLVGVTTSAWEGLGEHAVHAVWLFHPRKQVRAWGTSNEGSMRRRMVMA